MLARKSLRFLLIDICGRTDLEHPWLLERIAEVEQSPDGFLDLWAREHGKTSLITFGLTIQNILQTHGEGAEGEEVRCGIFSHTRPIAKSFLQQIKFELESNVYLKWLFPDILWANPRAEAPGWSLDNGIVVKRKANTREATVEAWGLIDGMPTSMHFNLMVYDDLISKDAVTTPEMVNKATEAFELSVNLESKNARRRMIGTRYSHADTYRILIERGIVNPRIYPATDDGTLAGHPVMWDRALWQKKVKEMGTKTAACQLLQNPREGSESTFSRDDLRWYKQHNNGAGMRVYILVDPAHSKKKGSDYTAMVVIGLSEDGNYYLLDGVRDRLSLEERATVLFELHRHWRPAKVGYERYGLQADIEHVRYRQEQENHRFEIVELGGRLSKRDRVERLLPVVEQHRLYLPATLPKTDSKGQRYDVIENWLTQEYDLWPVPEHDDFLDALSRVLDEALGITKPRSIPDQPREERYGRRRPKRRNWRSLW